MIGNVEKLIELVKTDEAFQQKIADAAKAYDGEKTEEAAFNAILAPLAEEYGLPVTYAEDKAAAAQKAAELSPDELEQTAGGFNLFGYDITGFGNGGLSKCTVIGGGVGIVIGSDGGGICLIGGIGYTKDQVQCYMAGTTGIP